MRGAAGFCTNWKKLWLTMSLVKPMRALYVARAAGLVKDAECDAKARAARRAHRGIADLARAGGCDGSLREGVRGGADARSGGERRRDSAGAMGPLAGRRPSEPACSIVRSLVSADEEARKGKKPGQLAAAIEIIRPGPAAFDPDQAGLCLVRRIAAGIGDRRGTRPGRPDRSSFPADSKRGGPTCSTGSRSPMRRGSTSGSTGHRFGSALWLMGPWARPMRASTAAWRPRARIGRWSVSGDLSVLSANGDQVELRLRVDQKTQAGDPPDATRRQSQAAVRFRGSSEFAKCGCRRASRRSGRCERGEVSLVDHVPPDQVAGLADSAEIKVGSYAQPMIHVIALDGRNPALRSRALRRALSYAVRPQRAARGSPLKHPATGKDTVADGAFPQGELCRRPGRQAARVAPWLAKMLVAAARKELGGQPIRLKFEYPAIPEVKVIAAKLADSFRAAGIEIETAEVLPSRLEAELRSGRRVRSGLSRAALRRAGVRRRNAPVSGLRRSCRCQRAGLGRQPQDLAASLAARACRRSGRRRGDWSLQIDRESRDELPVIPLWQLVDHYAWRDRLKGPG